MAGTVVLRTGPESVRWNTRFWIHDTVLADVAATVAGEDPPLAATLRACRIGAVGVGYCDLHALEAGRFRGLLRALRRAHHRTLTAGPAAFADPRFYPSYVGRFGELKAMLRWEPRSQNADRRPGRVIGPTGRVWTAPGWLYDLLLEEWAVEVEPDDPALAQWLLTARAISRRGRTVECDLRTAPRLTDRHLARFRDRAAEQHGQRALELERHAEQQPGVPTPFTARLAAGYGALPRVLAVESSTALAGTVSGP